MHALLGENGAGKSTLVKCLLGYYQADAGRILVDGQARAIAHPYDAHALGLGMVYQHFTLVPQMSVAENFVLGRERLPAVLDWAAEHAALREFMARMPFRLDLRRLVATLAAGNFSYSTNRPRSSPRTRRTKCWAKCAAWPMLENSPSS